MVIAEIFEDLLEEQDLLLEVAQFLVGFESSILGQLSVLEILSHQQGTPIHHVHASLVVDIVPDHELLFGDFGRHKDLVGLELFLLGFDCIPDELVLQHLLDCDALFF